MSMDENSNNTKLLMVALAVVVVIMISLTTPSNSFTVFSEVSAQNQEDKVGGGVEVSQQDCDKLLDKAKLIICNDS